VREPGAPVEKPTYFVLLEWSDGALVNIRDFRYARYATEGAELVALG
jgi:RNA polymerase sigma-70 factor, ECF subfamily